MFKVVLWDYTGESEACAKNYFKDDVKVIRTLHPDDPDQAEVIMRGDWNFVLIFENGQREYFNEIFKTMHELNVSTENIIFAKDFNSMANNPAAVYALFKPENFDNLYRLWNLENHKRWHQYNTCTVQGLHYVGKSKGDSMINIMYTSNKNHSADEMKLFYKLSQKYYNIDGRCEGIFLDLGANIGTTGIYFLKKFAPNLKLIAFEPSAETFKLLRINTILNDMEDKATLVNCGLGDKFDEMTMYILPEDHGCNSVFKLYAGQPTETIKIIPLDVYLAENKIPSSAVKYIWIDTEGFEPQVLFGARDLLKKSGAPIFMECNLLAWKESGTIDKMIELLIETGYSRFIFVEDFFRTGVETVLPVEKLRAFADDARISAYIRGRVGDIFLIKD